MLPRANLAVRQASAGAPLASRHRSRFRATPERPRGSRRGRADRRAFRAAHSDDRTQHRPARRAFGVKVRTSLEDGHSMPEISGDSHLTASGQRQVAPPGRGRRDRGIPTPPPKADRNRHHHEPKPKDIHAREASPEDARWTQEVDLAPGKPAVKTRPSTTHVRHITARRPPLASAEPLPAPGARTEGKGSLSAARKASISVRDAFLAALNDPSRSSTSIRRRGRPEGSLTSAKWRSADRFGSHFADVNDPFPSSRCLRRLWFRGSNRRLVF